MKQHPSASTIKQDPTDIEPKPKRVSVMFYIADERNTPVDIAAADSRQASGGSKLIFQAGTANAGDWQLHVQSSSESSPAIRSIATSG